MNSRYQLVATNTRHPKTREQFRANRPLILGCIMASVVGCLVGFFSSRMFPPGHLYPTIAFLQSAQKPGPLLDVTSTVVETAFIYNRTFGEDPSHNKATAEAWESIVPTGQGTVHFPADNGKVYTMSVIHQLHCLWSIHRSFYSFLSTSGEGSEKSNFVGAHMRHCFDYLRQSLMCAGDVTLEAVDDELGGVTGWGTQRVCRDYEKLTTWAEAHRANNLRGFLESTQSHHNPI